MLFSIAVHYFQVQFFKSPFTEESACIQNVYLINIQSAFKIENNEGLFSAIMCLNSRSQEVSCINTESRGMRENHCEAKFCLDKRTDNARGKTI